MLAKLLVKLANSRLGVPAKSLMRRLQETYYNAEVLSRPVTKIAPLSVNVSASAKSRVNILIPEINFARFYGGYMAKFHLARKLVEAGHSVRVITVDQSVRDIDSWKRDIVEYEGIEDIFDKIEVECCFDRNNRIEVSPNDVIIATTWWSAYIANALVKEIGSQEFIYLVQEYEPFTFPMGSYYALANESYAFPHRAFYSTELLQEYFQNNNVGWLHNTVEDRSDHYEYFENAIIDYPERTEIKKRASRERKLLFYARPEPHAARNMFETGFLALSKAIEDGVFDSGNWSFHGIGSSHGDIPLPKGKKLEMLGKFGLSEYKSTLLEYDLGLALMYTPHPSLLPLELACAGMPIVTNTCMNKTVDKLRALSINMHVAAPSVEGVANKLAAAVKYEPDLSSRYIGSKVNWARNWEDALDHRRMSKLNEWITSIRSH